MPNNINYMKKSTFLGAFILGIFWLVSSASSIAAQEKKAPALTLSDGQYEMQVTYKFYDEDKIMPNINVTVAVTVKDEKTNRHAAGYQSAARFENNGQYSRGTIE